MFVASSVEVWKFWSKLWVFVWRQCLAMKIMPGIKGWIKLCRMCTLKVSIFGGNSKLPSILHRELSSHRESDHRAVIPLWQIFLCQELLRSPTVILTRSSPHKCSGRKFSGEKKKKLKARTCEDQTQEYKTINITRIRRALYGPAALDWQTAWWWACKSGGR